MKIGVFDSGVGGESVANALRASLPNHEIIYVNDRENIPYGTKSKARLRELVIPILDNLVKQGCKIIVIACNTVTTNIISDLREKIEIPLIGIEPMVAPAVKLSKTGVITICATPATLLSLRYKELIQDHAVGVKVIEPDCSDWAQMIEDDEVDERKVRKIVEESLEQNSDVFVMGCTHYHWIEDIIDEMTAEKAVVLQPEEAIVERVKQLISDQALQN